MQPAKPLSTSAPPATPFAHLPPLLRRAPARARPRHPHRPGVAGPPRRHHDPTYTHVLRAPPDAMEPPALRCNTAPIGQISRCCEGRFPRPWRQRTRLRGSGEVIDSWADLKSTWTPAALSADNLNMTESCRFGAGTNDLVEALRRTGHAFLPSWQPHRGTSELARVMGRIVDIPSLLPGAAIPTIQSLAPRHEKDSPPNQYSAAFGLGAFPLHTDLAHWARPPRYLLLRCVSSGTGVTTRVLAASSVASFLSLAVLRRALVRPRRVGRRASVLLPVVFERSEDSFALRWDSLFLVPMNEASRKVAETIASNACDPHILDYSLTSPGDTLVLDNWRCLHGRGAVALGGMTRRLERAYISELDL